MALDTARAIREAQRAGNRPMRGKPQMIQERATTHVARLIEGQCFAQDVIAATSVIATAAAVGSRHVVVQEAGRLSVRAEAYRSELRRLAGEIG